MTAVKLEDDHRITSAAGGDWASRRGLNWHITTNTPILKHDICFIH